MPEADPIARIRQVCRTLPETVEKPFGGHTAPSFRVRDKLFVMIYEDHGAMAVKAAPGVQEALVASAPERFFVPPYVGHKGWIGVWMDRPRIKWQLLADLIAESYALVASPRRKRRG